MNGLLPLLLACCCGQTAADPAPTAREFFDQVERRYVDTARISFKAAITAKRGSREGKVAGTALFQGGNTFELKGDGTFGKGKLGWSITCAKGKATTTSVFDDPEHGEAEVTGSVDKSVGEEEATQTDDKERDARRAVLRCGMLLAVNRFPAGAFVLEPLVAEEPLNLAFGPETRLNDRPVRVLRYVVAIQGGETFTHELWIDRESLAILSREVRSEGGKTSIREVYTEEAKAKSGK